MSQDTATESLRFETFEAYLGWEEQQPIRYELHDGDVVAMAGATELHNRIATSKTLSSVAESEMLSCGTRSGEYARSRAR